MADNKGNSDKKIFYFGANRLEAPLEVMQVGALKDFIAGKVEGFNKDHVLVQEETGDRPDKPLADSDQIEIRHIPHFYDQPKATFGGVPWTA